MPLHQLRLGDNKTCTSLSKENFYIASTLAITTWPCMCVWSRGFKILRYLHPNSISITFRDCNLSFLIWERGMGRRHAHFLIEWNQEVVKDVLAMGYKGQGNHIIIWHLLVGTQHTLIKKLKLFKSWNATTLVNGPSYPSMIFSHPDIK